MYKKCTYNDKDNEKHTTTRTMKIIHNDTRV